MGNCPRYGIARDYKRIMCKAIDYERFLEVKELLQDNEFVKIILVKNRASTGRKEKDLLSQA